MIIRKLILAWLGPILRNRVYTAKSGLAAGLKRKGGLSYFYRPLNAEERFLQGLAPSLRNCSIYDIGAWEGVTTLFWARSVGEDGKVIVVEPNQESCERIWTNVRINNFHNVRIQQIGLGKESYSTILVFPRNSLAEGTAEKLIHEEIKKSHSKYRRLPILIDTLDHQVETYSLPFPDLVKIDVEGLEVDVLEGMSETIEKCRPKLFIEIHGASWAAKEENAKRVQEYLASRGYWILHVETGQVITSANTSIASVGHVFCEYDR